MRLHKRKGASYIMVIAVFIFVSLVSVLMLSMINQSVYQTQTYYLQIQAQYINKTTVDAVVQALLVDLNAELVGEQTMMDRVVNNEGNKFKEEDGSLEIFTQEYYDIDSEGKIPVDGSGKPTTDLLGISEFTLDTKKYMYYGEEKDWVVITTITTIPDTRTARKGNSGASVFTGTTLEGKKGFEYTSTTMILIENPIVQIYNADSSLLRTASAS